MVDTFDRQIKQIMTDRDMVSDTQMNEIMNDYRKENGTNGSSLAEVFVDREIVDEDDLISQIALEKNVPPVDLTRVQPSEDVLSAMDESVVKEYEVAPISKIGNQLTVAVADPFNLQKMDNLELTTGYHIKQMVSSRRQIRDAIERFYTENKSESLMEELVGDGDEAVELNEQDEDNEDISDLTDRAGESKVVRLVNSIIKKALDDGISDIHIEPWESKVRVRYRKDGVLRNALNAPRRMHAAMVSRIKIMSQMDIAERRAPQDGKFQMKYQDRKIDFRVSVLPTVDGEKVVMRILDPSGLALDLEQLGFEQQALDHFRQSINEPWGMILVTGPTGSGKSTTLYSALQELQTPEENVTTVEDPVEYELDGIVQVQVNPSADLTFAGSLRSILRQDPDIVLVGEIRDLETADIAIKAALTGHLVMSTLHTNDAPSAIARLSDMGVDEVMVASSLNLVSAQRLLRELCDHCKEPMDEQPDPEYMRTVGFTEEEIERDPVLYQAKDCDRCMNGFDGRFAVLETLFLDEDIRKMISGGATSQELKEYAIDELDMMTLRRCGIANAIKGKTSLDEVLRVTMTD